MRRTAVKLAVRTVESNSSFFVIADFPLCVCLVPSRARCFASNEIINQNCSLRTRVAAELKTWRTPHYLANIFDRIK